MRSSGIALMLLVANAGAAESHCSRQEQIIFSCTVARSSKVLSLCATKSLSRGNGALAYRFGRIGKIELQFPPAPEGSLEQFRFDHYLRFQVDLVEVSFSTGGSTFSVFDHFNGEEGPKKSRGVRVVGSDGRAREVEIVCREPVKSELLKLEGILACDTDSALGGWCRHR
jgi:hypothetical protein